MTVIELSRAAASADVDPVVMSWWDSHARV